MGDVVRLCDIDVSNSVYFTITNPHYSDSMIMDCSYDYPKDYQRILEVFKLAQRLDLKITYRAHGSEIDEWCRELYETYIGIET